MPHRPLCCCSLVIRLVIASVIVALVLPLHADEVPVPAEKGVVEDGVRWYQATDIGLEGKAWDDTKNPYQRFPDKAEGVVRDPVWSLSQHSAGIAVRFATDSPVLHARWTLTSSRLAMPHMAATGVSGLDLYIKTADGWRWVKTPQPKAQTNVATLARDLPDGQQQFLLYLPLYNGVTSLEIGLAPTANLASVRYEGERAKPMVFWGTSITQGACASRPGMVHTAILGRRLDRPVVNLGFSGNGRMEPEVAQLLTEIDASVYIIDCCPNLAGEQVAERTEPLVDILRSKHPETPILLVEDRIYADAFIVPARRTRNEGNQAALRDAYHRLRKRGVKHLYYLEGDKLLGADGEDTVDGSHPTDLGFVRQADAFQAVLKPILTD